jgi:hypothetical protein
MKRLTVYDLYPFLFSIYPIIALCSNNLIYVNFNSIIRSLILALVLTLLMVVLLSLIMRNKEKGKLLTVVILLIFFSYGQVYDILASAMGGALRHRFLSAIFLIAFVLIVWFILRARSIPPMVAKFLSVTSLALVIISIIPIIKFSITNAIDQNNVRKIEASIVQQQDLPKPDIYVIILDSYTRGDVLAKYFQFDNSPFLNQLKEMGFYVADCSTSNYPSTRYSLTSLMQGNYLQDINPDGSLTPFSHTLVIRSLRSMGYKVYSFENWSKGHFDLGEDKVFSRNSPEFGMNIMLSGLNEFESMLMKTTLLRILVDMPQLAPGLDLVHAEFSEHYQQVKYALGELPNLPAMESPKFVLAHILVPHEPYIFTPNGDYKYTGNLIKGYTSNVAFLNNNLPAILKKIIDNSKIPPVIIIQGDHGPNMNANDPEIRHSILNAYYVNDAAKSLLYPTISPINSFRVIFDSYFNGKLDLIPDKSYYAWGPKGMTDENLVPNLCEP